MSLSCFLSSTSYSKRLPPPLRVLTGPAKTTRITQVPLTHLGQDSIHAIILIPSLDLRCDVVRGPGLSGFRTGMVVISEAGTSFEAGGEGIRLASKSHRCLHPGKVGGKRVSACP